MSLTERVHKDMVDAMRKKEELRLSTLRMMKAALKNKEIGKRGKLEEKEELQVFITMIKQRKDSIEQFEKGNRPELARKSRSPSTSLRAGSRLRSARDDKAERLTAVLEGRPFKRMDITHIRDRLH